MSELFDNGGQEKRKTEQVGASHEVDDDDQEDMGRLDGLEHILKAEVVEGVDEGAVALKTGHNHILLVERQSLRVPGCQGHEEERSQAANNGKETFLGTFKSLSAGWSWFSR